MDRQRLVELLDVLVKGNTVTRLNNTHIHIVGSRQSDDVTAPAPADDGSGADGGSDEVADGGSDEVPAVGPTANE